MTEFGGAIGEASRRTDGRERDVAQDYTVGQLEPIDSGVVPGRSTELEQEYLLTLKVDRLDVAFTQAGDAGFASFLLGHLPDVELIELVMTFHESFSIQAFLPLNGQLSMLNTLDMGTNDIDNVGNLDIDGNLIFDGTGDIVNVNSIGVGTSDISAPIHIYADNTATSGTTMPHLLVEQDGTGDPAVVWELSAGQTWQAFIDNSDADSWKVRDITNTSDIFTVEPNAVAMRLDATGLGIGTSSPSTLLHLLDAAADVTLTIETDKVNGRAKLVLQNDVGGYELQCETDDDFEINDLTTGATPLTIEKATPGNTLYLDSTGVGIRTNSPATLLHLLDAAADITLTIETDKVGGAAQIDVINDTRTWRFGVGSSDAFGITDLTGVAVPFAIEAGAPSAALYINSAGNVGIGLTTPLEALSIFRSGANALVRVETNTAISAVAVVATGTHWNFQTSNADKSYRVRDANGAVTPLTIEQNTPTNTLYLDSSGNVGIGIANAGYDLQVYDGAGDCSLMVQSNVGSKARVLYRNTAGYWEAGAASAGEYFLRDVGAGTIPFTVEEATPTDTLYLDSAGNVGIGTSSPTYALDILTSSSTVFRCKRSTTGGAQLRIDTTTSGDSEIEFADDGTARWTIGHDDTDNSFHIARGASLGSNISLYVQIGTDNVGIQTASPVSTLEVAGSVGFLPSTQTTNFTAGDAFSYLCSNTITGTLPAASGCTGRVYHFKNIGTGTLTIDGNAAETIDGALTLVISLQYASRMIQSDGTKWHIL